MKYRRWIAKMAVALMIIGIGAVSAAIPASSASAAGCTLTTSISGPTKVAGPKVNGILHIKVSGCSGRYWTEYSYLNGPTNDGRTVT